MEKIRCQKCKHFYNFGFAMCEAFQEIPAEIMTGDNDHTQPLEGQRNDIVFEEKRSKNKKGKSKNQNRS